MERYLSSRDVPRTFSVSTVRELIRGAWITGVVICLGPTTAVGEIMYDLDDTHYTVVCKPDNSYLTFRVIMVCYTLIQHIIPSFVLIYQNISVAKTIIYGAGKGNE